MTTLLRDLYKRSLQKPRQSKSKKLLTIRTKRLERAIDRYFAEKAKGDGIFTDSDLKDQICNEIIRCAHLEGKSCAIVPGAIVLTTKTKTIWIVMQTYHPDKWIIKATI